MGCLAEIVGEEMIPITLDKVRHLRFTPNAIADAEEVMGKNLIAIVTEGGVRATRALLWAGLKWEDRSLTLEKVGVLMEKWMEINPYGELELKLVEALRADGWFKESARQQQEDKEAAGE